MATSPKKAPIPYAEMLRIYQTWCRQDNSGNAAELFKKHGWSRVKFFEAITFEEMARLHQEWITGDARGTQAAVFLQYGWSRNRFFEEAHRRGANV